MVKLTFLEVHLEGSSLTANAPFSDRDDESTAVPEAGSEADSGSGGRRGVAVVVGLLFLLALAALARRRLADDETIELG